MKSKDKHNHLFEPSGCISQSAFFSYLKHELTTREMHAIESHISECLFCSNAMEGYEKQSDKDKLFVQFSFIKDEVNNHLNNFSESASKKKDNKRYPILAWSIAASFTVIIIGYFLINRLTVNDKKMDLAINTPITKELALVDKALSETKTKNASEEKAIGNNDQSLQLEQTIASGNKPDADKVYRFYNNGKAQVESGGEVVAITNTIDKDSDFKSVVSTENKASEDRNGLIAIDMLKDQKVSGKISDITTTINQKDDSKKENAPVAAQTVTDEWLSGKNPANEEVVVISKKEKLNAKAKNEQLTAGYAGDHRGATKPATLKEAILYYDSGNYEKALIQFQNLLIQDKNNFAAIYYYALCKYKNGNKQDALAKLDTLIKKKNNPFYEMALWQKAQIIEEMNDKKQSVEIYREIIKNGGSMKNNAVKKINELEK
jgi:tetratricopeptide (TPR) repeat protein